MSTGTAPANAALVASASPASSASPSTWLPRYQPKRLSRDGFRVAATTRCPSANSAVTSRDPTYPVAPVTRIRTLPTVAFLGWCPDDDRRRRDMATLRCADRELPLKFTNRFLAHLQVAVHRRFKKAGGFFLTGTVTNADGKDVTVSHWLNRFTPLEFEYDIRDDNGDRIAPVELDPKEIDAILDAMDRPGGVHDTADVWVTFRDKLD